MKLRFTVIALAVVALFTGLAGVASAQEASAPEPTGQAPALEAPASADLLVTSQSPNLSTEPAELDLDVAGLPGGPSATATCTVNEKWVPDSCSCPGGFVRERLYQQVCCPWGCSGWLVTSSTRCTPHGCF